LTEERDFTEEFFNYNVEWTDHPRPSEYAVFGWFK